MFKIISISICSWICIKYIAYLFFKQIPSNLVYHYIFLSVVLAFLAGCSSNNTLNYMSAIEHNQRLDINSLYRDDIKSKGINVELALMEKGRIAQLQGDYSVSMSSFKEVIDILRQRELYDDTLPGAQLSVGSVLVNDNLLAYRSRLFEVEMIYLYQSFNYLAEGSLEGALVEIRRADFLLNEADKARKDESFDDAYFRSAEAGVQKKLFESQDSAQLPQGTGIKRNKSTAVNSGSQQKQLTQQEIEKQEEYENLLQNASSKSFTEMGTLLSKSKSSFLNPYVVYMSGVIHELDGEMNDAYISFKKGLALMSANPYLQSDVIRLAKKLNRIDDLNRLKSAYPETWNLLASKPVSDKNGRLIVIYEDGWIQRKQESKVSMGPVSIAYPVYRYKWIEPSPLIIKSDSGLDRKTSPICYMSALTLRALKEEEKWRVIRQTARAAVKGSAFATGVTMTAVSDDPNVQLGGILVMIFSSMYNNMTENADLRCWMTLPENVQILTENLPEGTHRITFTPYATQLRLEKNIPILKDKTTLVWVVHVGSRLIYVQLWPSFKHD